MRGDDNIADLGRYVSIDAVLLVGRVLMSAIFILSARTIIVDFDSTTDYIRGLGMPYPETLNVVELIVEGLGGLALLTGLLFRFATLGVMVHVIVASVFVHHFWTMTGGQGFNQYFHFMKNVSIVGGLLFFNIQGPGRFSLSRMWEGEERP